MEELRITDEYLQELISHIGSSLVGKVMKRHEILGNNISAIKSDTRELIYESFRELQQLIYAYNRGKEISIFQFKKQNHPPEIKKVSE